MMNEVWNGEGIQDLGDSVEVDVDVMRDSLDMVGRGVSHLGELIDNYCSEHHERALRMEKPEVAGVWQLLIRKPGDPFLDPTCGNFEDLCIHLNKVIWLLKMICKGMSKP